MNIIDNLMVLLPIALVLIALLLAGALAMARHAGVTRGPKTGFSQADFGRAAGDPFFHPFGEMPIVPRERQLIAADFRAWGIPDTRPSAGALRRNENGGRSASLSGTAVVLTFRGRKRHA